MQINKLCILYLIVISAKEKNTDAGNRDYRYKRRLKCYTG